jgi:2-hydroxy-3-keto-5-methylthiopentenyl-1-phosphate phosphatase
VSLIVYCDFDGTVVPCDVEFEMFARFGGPRQAGEVVARWSRGEITARQRIEQGFANLHAPLGALNEFLDSVPIDPAFPAFVRFCREAGAPLVIVSEGMAWYIRRILERHGVGPLPMLANEIAFADPHDVSTARLAFPHYNGACDPCGQCGCCKRDLLRAQKGQGQQVVFISDGWADRHAAREADVLFARDNLLDYCRAQSLPALAFSDFDGVRRALGERLGATADGPA